MLPEVETWDAMPGEAALRPGVERLCGELGVAPAGLVRYVSGSRPVYAAGDLVLKLFPRGPARPDAGGAAQRGAT
jgi:hypothetical protein